MCTKIYYASRTHSQLSQVLHELEKLNIRLNVALPSMNETLEKTKLGKRSAAAVDDVYSDQEGLGPRVVSLGSWKQLCIHERLREKAGDIDEACRQMLGGPSSFSPPFLCHAENCVPEKGKARCPHLPSIDEETRMLDLRDQILVGDPWSYLLPCRF